MKKVQLFYLPACPYCKEVFPWIEEAKRDFPELTSVEIEQINEARHPIIANRYDYWYVPTFYVDGKKVHEGVCSREIVLRVLRMAIDAPQ